MLTLSYFHDGEIGTNRASTIQVLKNCNAFQQIGFSVTLYTPLMKDLDIKQARSLYDIDNRIQIVQTIYSGIAKFILNTLFMLGYFIIKRDKSQIVYTRNFYFAFLIGLTQRVVVFECHQYKFEPAFHTYLQWIILKMMTGRHNFLLVVISETLKLILNQNGIHMPMLVCHDGYDDKSDQSDTPDMFSSLDRSRYDAVAMYAGSLTYNKGLDHIDYLVRMNRNVLFYIIGNTTSFCDPDMVTRLQQHANVILSGLIEHSRVSAYLKHADILLLLPTSAGVYNSVTSPLKLFEYMHAGKAILATDGPSLQEIIQDGHNGLLASDDNDAINDRFRLLVSKPELRENLGRNAKQGVWKYSWKQRATRIMDYLVEQKILNPLH